MAVNHAAILFIFAASGNARIIPAIRPSKLPADRPARTANRDHKRIKTGAGSSQPLLRTFGPRQKVRETLVDEHALGGLAVLRVLVIFGAINVRLRQFVFRLAAVIRGAVEIRSEVPLVTSRLSH
jgi:hypothetical protein